MEGDGGGGERRQGRTLITLKGLTSIYKPVSSLCSSIPLLFFAELTLDFNLSLLLAREKKQPTSMVNAVKVFKKTAPNGKYCCEGSCETVF